MVTFPPYLASSLWYSRWLKAYSFTKYKVQSMKEANMVLEDPRTFARTLISPVITLSIPIVGGGRQLRSFSNVESVILSEHGNWQKNHLGAIETEFGRYPFFSHIVDGLKSIYETKETITLRDFNLRIHSLLLQILIGDLGPNEINIFATNEILIKRGKEFAKEIIGEESVIVPLMKFGKEALTGLMAL